VHLQTQIGKTLHVLTERGGIARAEDFTALTLESDIPHGQLLNVRVTKMQDETLFASPI
jgi:threonylcarbamoyladenosine tRNA methylthiotransferase MtaB